MVTAIIVAAGKGLRMKSDVPKQFMLLHDRPVLFYTLKAFEESNVDHIIVVTTKIYVDYVKTEIVERYNLKKVVDIIVGGNERYESVYCALKVLKETDYVLIHDGARPLVRIQMINRIIREVYDKKAVIAGTKSKDTVKMVNDQGVVEKTIDRDCLWNVQTPQAFEYNILKSAYDMLIEQEIKSATDDSMVVELTLHTPVYMIEGQESNIKITTPEDMEYAKNQLLCGEIN